MSNLKYKMPKHAYTSLLWILAWLLKPAWFICPLPVRGTSMSIKIKFSKYFLFVFQSLEVLEQTVIKITWYFSLKILSYSHFVEIPFLRGWEGGYFVCLSAWGVFVSLWYLVVKVKQKSNPGFNNVKTFIRIHL